eukprot:GHVT01077829.1.p1 GENE.GHVT01077829.1~~GHVT01077829.1.p1  ORF type:complete len:106 (+),score=11.18 GHVT01077829.1:371-688(+)
MSALLTTRLLDLRNVESDIKRLTAPQEKLLQRHIHLLAVRQTATEPEKSTPVERGVEAAAAELCAASSTSKGPLVPRCNQGDTRSQTVGKHAGYREGHTPAGNTR